MLLVNARLLLSNHAVTMDYFNAKKSRFRYESCSVPVSRTSIVNEIHDHRITV